jgi:hypothetical protein
MATNFVSLLFLDPEWKKYISGINISDPQHCLSYNYNKVLFPWSEGKVPLLLLS